MNFFFAQETIPYYSKDEDFYKGGLENFYKEIHEVIVNKKLLQCENKRAFVYQKFLVTEIGEFKKVKDLLDGNINSDKCTEDLLNKILPELNNWIPAKKRSENIIAQSSFIFFPEDLFDNYKENYNPKKLYADSFFIGGVNAFRIEVAKKVDISGYNASGKVMVVISFVVDIDGSVIDVKVEESSGLKEFDDEFVFAVKSVNRKWTPAKINGKPVKQRFKIPFTVNF